MKTENLVQQLQAALCAELGAEAPVYMLIDDKLYEVLVQVNPKGGLGPGSVLLMKGSLDQV